MIETGDSQSKNDTDEAEKKSEGKTYAKCATNLNYYLTGSKRNSKKGQGVDKKEEEKETTESEISNTSTPLRWVKLVFLSASFIS